MQYRSKYLEINIKKKQHLAFEFMPYGFGYDNPLLIIKLFIISFYITLPFKIKEKDSDISYGFIFYDIDHSHWWPDCLRLSFGKFSKSYDMPWLLVLFDTQYESNFVRGNIHLKDTNKNDNIFKQSVRILLNNGNSLGLKYYKETRILKMKPFGHYIEFRKKILNILNIEYNEPNYDISDKGRTFDMIFFNKNETTQEAFERYCKKYNLTLI